MIYICSCNTWVCHFSNLSCLFKVIIQHKKVNYLENFPTYMLNTTTNNYNELLNPTDTPRWIDVDSTWILRRRPNFEEFPRNFHLFFRCNFAGRKSTSFPRTFFDVISMIEKSMLFPRTLLGLILMVEKSTLFFSLSSIMHVFYVFLIYCFIIVNTQCNLINCFSEYIMFLVSKSYFKFLH